MTNLYDFIMPIDKVNGWYCLPESLVSLEHLYPRFPSNLDTMWERCFMDPKAFKRNSTLDEALLAIRDFAGYLIENLEYGCFEMSIWTMSPDQVKVRIVVQDEDEEH